MRADLPLRFSRAKRGAALIIVLFFVVLLTGLTIIFLSRSLTAHQASSSSTSGTKASVMAESACEIILGDLKQEIVDGSSATTPATGYNVYTPKATASATAGSTAIPAIVGFTPAITGGLETDGLANLIKVSVRSQPFYSATANSNYAHNGIIRASAVNSSTDASVNGRVITSARWNSHFLLGRKNTGSTQDPTPVTAFPAPDWVIVTRSGASTAYSGSQVSLLNSPNGANSGTYAIGRFAYAIYDEGGLLDMNAAGYPSKLPAQLASQKGSSGLADLTQLPTTTGQTQAQLQAQFDNLVGWRNAYTSQLSSTQSTFGSVSFTSATATNWFNNFAAYNTGQINSNLNNNAPMVGFMQANTNSAANFFPTAGVYPNQNTSAPTDQVLLSRQQLISLIESLSISPDTLQYLGTFSRCLEQPSYAPASGRPLILSATTPPPAQPGEGGYLGNNNGAGGDALINPSFLAVRATSAFTRFNGTTAVVGEPLVKYRFPLNRLAMVAYNAINTALPAGFATTTADSDPIYDRFGLKRTSASSPWVYNHGSASILTLSQVAALTGANAREPDFAELLKAAITAGALGKAAPNFQVNNTTTPGDNFEYTIDSSIDYQVLQIMANLIDQQDADSYPTWIQIASGPGGTTNIYGVEDLPYLYRENYMPVTTVAPTKPVSTGAAVTLGATTAGGTREVTTYQQWSFPGGTQSAATVTKVPSATFPATLNGAVLLTTSTVPAAPIPPAVLGTVGYMYVVQLWNPHDPNTAIANSSALRPAKFRLIATTQSPAPGSTAWKLGAVMNLNLSSSLIQETDGASPPGNYYWPITPVVQLTAANTALDFTDGNGTYFREPTQLWNQSIPNLAPESGVVGKLTDINTTNITPANTYYGVVVGTAPMQMVCQVTTVGAAASPGDGNYLVQAYNVGPIDSLPASVAEQITFSLQYQDPNNSSNWITYDNAYTWPNHQSFNAPALELSTDSVYSGANNWKSPLASQLSFPTVQFDPRTARWGVEAQVHQGEISSGTNGGLTGTQTGTGDYLLEPAGNKFMPVGAAPSNTGMESSNFSVFETERPRADKGESDSATVPGDASGSGAGLNPKMHLFSGSTFSTINGTGTNPAEFGGLMTQNNPVLTFNSTDGTTTCHYYFEDADGVARRGMAAYADTTMTDTSTSSLAQTIASTPHRIGLPEATANTYAANNAVGTSTQQSQSRPIVLNRPFHSVSEMSYSFTGTPWRNIDFFTPESGYAALLDVFCLGDPPASGLTAGKVDLNTRQEPVIQALVAGASRDEWYNAASPPNYVLPPLTGNEAKNVATSLVKYTTDLTDYWRGPLGNLSQLVGRFVSPSVPATQTPSVSINNNLDWYTYSLTSPASGSVTYAGFTGLLDSSVYNDAGVANNGSAVSPIIQRFRESALRPLADNGQTRVWNLLIDVIAQTGRYPGTATGLGQFEVDGEKRIWLHVAIDRYTGQVLDKQVEVVAQ